MASLIIMLIIIALAAFQLAQVAVTYVQNKAELDAARQKEAELTARKADLESDIERWNDNAYVEAQARSRLGFVYPGEKPVYLVNTGRDSTSSSGASGSSSKTETMPWYRELMYSLEKSDSTDSVVTDATVGGALDSGSSSGSSSGGSSSTATDATDPSAAASSSASDGAASTASGGEASASDAGADGAASDASASADAGQ